MRKKMQYIVLLGRIFFSAIFIMSSFTHFTSGAVAYAAYQGVPFPHLLVPFSGVIALLGGLSILLGYKARIGALLIVIFLVPVTVMMHNFWAVSDPLMANLQKIMFLKNLAMLGGALIIFVFGSGPLSLSKSRKDKF
jgi:putative oxidoreductase